MENIEFKLPDAIQNMIFNDIIKGLSDAEKDGEVIKATLETFNQHGINSSEAMVILRDINNRVSEINNLYGDYEVE